MKPFPFFRGVLFAFVIIRVGIFPSQLSETSAYADVAGGMANPAAVYCVEMGYEYKIIDGPSGQRGVCMFPDGSECEGWAFLEGKCGQEYSYCAQHGYDTRTKRDGNNPFSREYAVCVSEGKEIGSVTDLMDIGGEATKSSSDLGSLRETIVSDSENPDSKNPSSFDWRSYVGYDWMTPVKSQGSCGSCWAFASVGAVEALYNIYENDYDLNLDLSEEYLVSDCHTYSHWENCCGGWTRGPGASLEFIRDSGIPDEDCMPYIDYDCSCDNSGFPNPPICSCYYNADGSCSDATCSDRCEDWQDRLVMVDEYGYVSSDRDVIKQHLYEKGPLTAGMRIGDGYWDGDIYRCNPDTPPNHYLILAGYNDDGEYWIAKNSWGTGFGEGGYFKVGYGECGIESDVNYVEKERNLTCGNVNGDGEINIGDVVYLISYLFRNGPHPECCPTTLCGDVNGDKIINVGDVVYLVSYLYKGGPEPVC